MLRTFKKHWLLVFAILASGMTASVVWARLAPEPTHINGIYITSSKDEIAQAAYAVAMREPELLSQLPCHCGCMARKGDPHGSVLDCFRTAHAETCPICQRTATYAGRAAAEGRTIGEMRRYLKNVFGSDF